MAVLPTMTTSKMSVTRRAGAGDGPGGQVVDLVDDRALQLGQTAFDGGPRSAAGR